MKEEEGEKKSIFVREREGNWGWREIYSPHIESRSLSFLPSSFPRSSSSIPIIYSPSGSVSVKSSHLSSHARVDEKIYLFF